MDPMRSKGRFRYIQNRKRNEVNMEIKTAKRNELQDKIVGNNAKNFSNTIWK